MKEKWVQINKIQGFEDVREWYWISNSNEDKIINRNTGKMRKLYINHGYLLVKLITNQGKVKNCRIHVLKAKAFIFSPNPLGATLVRHLDDCKTNNALTNLTFGTRSDNAQDSIRNGHYNYEASAKGRAIGGAKGRAVVAKKIRMIRGGE